MSLIEKYAFRGDCAATPDPNAAHTTVRGPCCFCRAPQAVTVETPDLAKFRAGNFAQDCFPYLNADQREFLISGICGPCWNDCFSEDDDPDGETPDD